jgi:hypothetical protein
MWSRFQWRDIQPEKILSCVSKFKWNFWSIPLNYNEFFCFKKKKTNLKFNNSM